VIALLAQRFIPVAENCSPLQSQPDAKGDFFRLVAEQGHYGGRTFPTATRQGLYAFTPDGISLGAMNTREAGPLLAMLRRALDRFDGLDHTNATAPAAYDPWRPDRYPHDGLVLRAIARDLPREVDTRPDDWRKVAWNLDYAWFGATEAASLVPSKPVVGATAIASPSVAWRLARFHLRDFVRGEPAPWPAEAVQEASLGAMVTAADGQTITLATSGRATMAWDFRWVRPHDGAEVVSPCRYDATLRGEATWDRGSGRFAAFTLVAWGPRYGAHRYTNRSDDLGPAPMAIAFTLASDAPRDRTPPHVVGHPDYFAPAGPPS
jgi:hypothetical protein